MTVNRTPALGVCADSLCSEERLVHAVIGPLTGKNAFRPGADTAKEIRRSVFKGMDLNTAATMEEAAEAVVGGSFVLFLEGDTLATVFGAQGYPKMSVGEPPGEQNEFGGQEGFTDCFKDNISLLRRKLPSPRLRIEKAPLPHSCRTPAFLCYLDGAPSPGVLSLVRERLRAVPLDTLLGSGWLRPFLNGGRFSLFSGSGVTERPDMLAAKLGEGRVGILVDGTPFAVIVPYLWADSFHSLDDYLVSPVYALFIRLLRYLCFGAAIALPGLFVAVCVFHPKLLPQDILGDIAAAEARTPFPLTLEAIAIHLIYEAVREAGLRMPRAAGTAVGIVGALVIGDAAVKAGLIASPMLIIVGITTVSSAVNPKLHDRIVPLRLLLIAAGGCTGLFGVFLGLAVIALDMSASAPFGVAYSAPYAPFLAAEQTDALWRAPWKILARRRGGGRNAI